MTETYNIFPLGDGAVTIDLGNIISEALNNKVLAMQHWLLAHPFTGQLDIVIAYSSLTVFYDPYTVSNFYHPAGLVSGYVSEILLQAYRQSGEHTLSNEETAHIPVCYDPPFSPDLRSLAHDKQMDAEEIIRLHTETTYRVYTIGFLPGFSYMATVHESLVTPRKPVPVPVAAGSIGIAGAQTGIYSLNSPGGWHIIGRTPLKQFDPGSPSLVTLRVGNIVRFYRISTTEMEQQQETVLSTGNK